MKHCVHLVCLFFVFQISIISAQEQSIVEERQVEGQEISDVAGEKIGEVFFETESIELEELDAQDRDELLEQSLQNLKLTELRPVESNSKDSDDTPESRSPNPPNYLLINSPELNFNVPAIGELGPGDGQNFRDASYLDIWQFIADEGEAIEIQVRSDFDSFLTVYSPDGELYATNDDAMLEQQSNQDSLSQDAALRMRLQQAGRYMVVLSGVGKESIGGYSLLSKKLLVQEGGGLEFSQAVYASFGEGDQKDSDLALRFDEFDFELEANQTLSFDIFVEDYEGRLLLFDGKDKLIADSSIQGNPMIEQLEAGKYSLRAAIFDDGSVDKKDGQENLKLYKLEVEALELSFQSDVAIGDDFLSLLATKDRRIDDRFIDSYRLVVSEITEAVIDLRSKAFDAYLYLYDDSGHLVAENDDASEETGTDSQLFLELPAGVYNIIVTSYIDADKKTGLYNLSVKHPTEDTNSNLKLDSADDQRTELLPEINNE